MNVETRRQNYRDLDVNYFVTFAVGKPVCDLNTATTMTRKNEDWMMTKVTVYGNRWCWLCRSRGVKGFKEIDYIEFEIK